MRKKAMRNVSIMTELSTEKVELGSAKEIQQRNNALLRLGEIIKII